MVVLAHKELSYIIVGALFEAYNRLGYGYQEKLYQKAVAQISRNQLVAVQTSTQIHFASRALGRCGNR